MHVNWQGTVVKSFSKTPAIIIYIELVTLFYTFFGSHMLAQYTGASIVEKKIQKKIQNFREIVVRQISFVNYCKNHHKKRSFSPRVTAGLS
jgi:hypothetical protein